MNFKQVEAFRAVMATRSMTTAATLLHTSQPNISRWISLLEKELGFELFQRSGTRLMPTGDANIFYSEVERSFRGLEILKDTAASIKKKGMGVLRVGAGGFFTQFVLPLAIRNFRKTSPDSPVLINTGSSGNVTQWVATGLCDVGFVSITSDVAGVKYECINSNQGVGVIPAHHALAKKVVLEPTDFESQPFIALPSGSPNRSTVDAFLGTVSRPLAIETHYASTICTMVELGLGVSIVNSLVPQSLALSGVEVRPLSSEVIFHSYCVSSEQYASGLLASQMIDCVNTAFEQLNAG